MVKSECRKPKLKLTTVTNFSFGICATDKLVKALVRVLVTHRSLTHILHFFPQGSFTSVFRLEATRRWKGDLVARFHDSWFCSGNWLGLHLRDVHCYALTHQNGLLKAKSCGPTNVWLTKLMYSARNCYFFADIFIPLLISCRKSLSPGTSILSPSPPPTHTQMQFPRNARAIHAHCVSRIPPPHRPLAQRTHKWLINNLSGRNWKIIFAPINKFEVSRYVYSSKFKL